MNTTMSTKRAFIPSGKSVASRHSRMVHESTYALVGGLLAMVAAIVVNSELLMAAGFFAAVIGGHILNSAFWASYFEKHPDRIPDIRTYEDYE